METFPKTLLKDVYWAFGGRIYEDMEAFNHRIGKYQIDITEKDSWQPDTLLIEASKIKIVYETWEGDDEVEKELVLSSDNNRFFTKGEFMFKLHNAVTESLKGIDHSFFEGLNLNKVDADNVPLYEMRLGS